MTVPYFNVVEMGDVTGSAVNLGVGYGLSIVNRSGNSLLLEVSSLAGMELIIPPHTAFTDYFPRFTSFTITETDPADEWSYIVKG